jgi:hypothetical protein
MGDTTLALEHYAAIVIDRPRDIVALALVQPRNVSERKGPWLRREAGCRTLRDRVWRSAVIRA